MALRILVVDDAAFVRDTVKRTLRKFLPGVDIIDATNGHRAVSALKTNKIDLILSDWEMPEMSGEELLQWVRAQERYQNTPFIMVSSRGDKDHVITAVKSGVSDYLAKPFTPEELQIKVVKQLKRMGYKLKGGAGAPGSQSSLDALTSKTKAQTVKPREVKDAAAIFAKPASQPTAKKAAPASSATFRGKAQLRFPNAICECDVRDLSLQALNGVMSRPDKIPSVFDQAAVDISDNDGNIIGRLNAYVHGITAADPRPSSDRLKIMVRFVDNDPDKFEQLSKFVTR